MKKVAVLGYGGRGCTYAKLCKQMPEDFQVVAVIDNSQEKLGHAMELGLKDDQLFLSLDDFLSAPKTADWLFVCTQDADHREHSVKALQAGYHLLLEKPIACTIADCLEIEQVAKEMDRRVAVCHVLRYSAYYETIKEVMDSGVLGKIIAIDQVENVGYWHQAHSFVRGDWRRKEESTPMIVAKCCHDLDMAVYLAGSKCRQVTSQGRLNYFNRDNAPEGVTEYCLDGCKAKADCPYDCEKIYVDTLKDLPEESVRERWPQARLMADGVVTVPKLYEAMKNTRYGKCVFLSDNDVVDYQVTTMQFENGITSTLTMTAFSHAINRETRIRGTLGELVCDMGEKKITLYVFGKEKQEIPLGEKMDGHGGGDQRLIAHLAEDTMRTDITESIESHLIAFAAEESRLANGTPVVLADMRKRYAI